MPLSEHCQELLKIAGVNNFSLYALFLMGLAGSVSHCSSMCGPFVIAQASNFEIPQGKNVSSWYRLLLLPYHLGRLTTYTLLGIIATIFATPIFGIPALKIISPLLLALAGGLFLASAFSQFLPKMTFGLCGTPSWLMHKISSLMKYNSLFGGYILGVMLGFIPCGLVYAAILAVMTTGDATKSALGMIAFAAGTMPTLMVISLGGRALINQQYAWLKPASAVLMVFNSIVLFVMAGKGFI